MILPTARSRRIAEKPAKGDAAQTGTTHRGFAETFMPQARESELGPETAIETHSTEERGFDMTRIKNCERRIAQTSRQIGIALDIHGRESRQYKQLRSELARQRKELWALKCELCDYAVVA